MARLKLPNDMTATLDRLTLNLESALGTDLVSRESSVLSGYAMDGKPAKLVCLPTTAEQVTTILRICAEAKTALSPWGGGTGVNVGNPPREPCVAIDLSHLNRVIEHDHANLTVTAQSGITLAALRETLLPQQQFLPFDAPRPAKATLGGTIALNMNGPRRGFYGGVRDLVIGMKVALITGEQIKAGGKVVKNVAGYDMCKLFTGALGTLGVITEATVRVAPVPETGASIIVSGSFTDLVQFADRLSQSPLLPAAVMLTNFQQPHGAGDDWQVTLWCEGLAEHVARHLSEVEILARQLGMAITILRDHAHLELWDAIQDFPLKDERCVYRVTLPRAEVASYIAAVSQMIKSPPALISDLVMGTVWLSWPADSQAAILWTQLTSLAAARRGHAVIFAAPAQLKEGHDVWGAPAATHALMRKIKQQFDPNELLNPGRFIAGI
jgi:glycolate oxidase FAD binding subunit